MVHKDFEKYALERPMNGKVSNKFIEVFDKHFLRKPYNTKNMRVLDSGCGDGKYFEFLKLYFKPKNIFGVEISKKRIERCHKRGFFNAMYLQKNEKLPFKDEFFDLIISDQIIEHIPRQEANFYVSELARVLNKRGRLIIITPNYPIKRVYDFLKVLSTFNLDNLSDDPTHICFYNFNKLNVLLGEHFKYVKLIPTGGFFWKIFKKNITSHKIIAVGKKIIPEFV